MVKTIFLCSAAVPKEREYHFFFPIRIFSVEPCLKKVQFIEVAFILCHKNFKINIFGIFFSIKQCAICPVKFFF